MNPRAPDFDIKGPDIPRDLFPAGRVRFSIGATAPREVRRRREALAALREHQEWEILSAIQDGTITVPEVVRRLKQGGIQAAPEIRGDVDLRRTGEIPTFAGETAAYLEWYTRKRGSQSVRNVRSRLKRLGEQPVQGGTTLGAVLLPRMRQDHAERAIEAVSGAAGTQHGLRAAGSGLFTWSVQREAELARTDRRLPRWSTNPFSAIELGERHPRVETASDDQVRDLLAAAQLYQMAYVRIFAQIGMRLSELSHTRFHTDLDVATWEWAVQPRGPDPRCGCIQCQNEGWSPKTKHGIRTFIVPEDQPELRDAIAAYLEASPAGPGDFAFRNPRTGEVWEDSTLRNDFRALCEAAGVRYGRDVPGGITIHSLRHTAATALVRAEVRESVIASLLGDTVETVVTTYVHLTAQDLGKGIARGPRYA